MRCVSYRRAGRLAVTDPPPIHTAQAATDTLHLARLQNTPAPSAHLTHSSSAVNLSQTHRPAPPTHTRRHTFGSGLTLLHCTISHSQPAAHAHAIARTAAPHARARPQTTAFSYSIPPSLFSPSAKRQLQARRPRREGSSREVVATTSCWEHIWPLEEK